MWWGDRCAADKARETLLYNAWERRELSPLTVLKVEEEIIKSLGEKYNTPTFTFSQTWICFFCCCFFFEAQKQSKWKVWRRNIMKCIILSCCRSVCSPVYIYISDVQIKPGGEDFICGKSWHQRFPSWIHPEYRAQNTFSWPKIHQLLSQTYRISPWNVISLSRTAIKGTERRVHGGFNQNSKIKQPSVKSDPPSHTWLQN